MNRNSTLIQDVPLGMLQEPDWRTSKMGYKFDFYSDIWQMDGSITINLGRMRDLDSETKEGLRKSLCRYAEELSGSVTDQLFAHFNIYCDHTGARSVTVNNLTNWRVSLDSENEYKLGALKGFLMAWNEWGYPGVTDEVADYLEELKLKGNVKGKAVKRACPYSGPLTQIELGALLDWASNAFISETIDLSQYAFFLTLAFTGRRAAQVRWLRTCDLIYKDDTKGHDYVVKFPRAKQRGSGFRKEFNPLSVNEDLYLILQNQAEASQANIERVLGKKLPSRIRQKIPLFLAKERCESLRDLEHLVECLDETPDSLHMTKQQAMAMLRIVAVKNLARSERTGEFINFTSRRFRYTKGTNLSKRGMSGIPLALSLDQTTTQNVYVYVDNTEETATQLDANMTHALAPLAQAFAGLLINSERDALRANDPHSRVKNSKTHVVGNCGTHAFCASGYRACYTCGNFQPWRDAPHQEVFDEILIERNRQNELGVSPYVIESTDRLLLAVQQVILMCKEDKAQVQIEVKRG